MATYIKKQLKEMTRCCICTEEYSEPRILSCIHTFCLRCLEQVGIQSDKRPGDKLPCPICRKEFVIPEEGMNGVQKNFFMHNLIELAKVGNNPPEKISCDICLKDFGKIGELVVDVPLATGCCRKCRENLCNGCSMYHKKQNPIGTHEIVPLGSEVVSKQVESPAKFCRAHSNKPLEIYCHGCKTTGCVLCLVEKHQSHECGDIQKVSGDFRHKLDLDAQNMSYLLSEGTTRLASFEKVRTDVNRKVDLMERDMRTRADDLKVLIDKHFQLQLEDLSRRKQGMLKKLEVDQDEMKRQLTIVESFQSYCYEVRSNGSPGDVCTSAADLHSRADELQQMYKSSFRVPVAQFNCSFCKMELEDILELRKNNIIGCIKDNAAAVVNPVVKAMDDGKKVPSGVAYKAADSPQQNYQRQPMWQPMPKQKQLQQFHQMYAPPPRAIVSPATVYPQYWRRYKDYEPRGVGSACQKIQIHQSDRLYKELENMFNCVLGNTSKPKHARNCYGDPLDRSRKISKIWCIENASLYDKYAEKKDSFRANALVNTYRPLSSLLGSEVETFKSNMLLVNSTLDRKVNETFLFYGATHKTQEHISKMGFSALHGACNMKPFGPERRVHADREGKKCGSTGICFRETLENQDDIDNIDQKWGLGEYRYGAAANQSVRYVFIARVLLGNSYLCRGPSAFKRSPCMKRKCYSDSCNHHAFSGSFDSVIGTGYQYGEESYDESRDDSDSDSNSDRVDQRDRPMLMRPITPYPMTYNCKVISWPSMSSLPVTSCSTDVRNFIIYSPEQSYPDFLIEYQ